MDPDVTWRNGRGYSCPLWLCTIGRICNRCTGFVAVITSRRARNVSECLYSLDVCLVVDCYCCCDATQRWTWLVWRWAWRWRLLSESSSCSWHSPSTSSLDDESTNCDRWRRPRAEFSDARRPPRSSSFQTSSDVVPPPTNSPSIRLIVIRRLETRLQPNIGFTFERAPYARFYRFSPAKFHEIWTQHVDRCRDESYWNRILKISP